MGRSAGSHYSHQGRWLASYHSKTKLKKIQLQLVGSIQI